MPRLYSLREVHDHRDLIPGDPTLDHARHEVQLVGRGLGDPQNHAYTVARPRRMPLPCASIRSSALYLGGWGATPKSRPMRSPPVCRVDRVAGGVFITAALSGPGTIVAEARSALTRSQWRHGYTNRFAGANELSQAL